MNLNYIIGAVLSLILLIERAVGIELTFELADNAKECFYEEIELNQASILEYQVISGGHYDVDCRIEDPDGLELYSKKKQQYDSYEWTTQKKGVYKFCFSNEFSTLTHKVVYFDLQTGAEAPLLPDMVKATALTQMETSAVTMHEILINVMDYQTKFRLKEATGRIFAHALNDKVQIWSFFQMLILILVSIVQVVVLRSFFANKKYRSTTTT